MMGLPEGRKSLKIGLTVYRHNTGVCRTDRPTDRPTPHDGKDRAMQSVARV